MEVQRRAQRVKAKKLALDKESKECISTLKPSKSLPSLSTPQQTQKQSPIKEYLSIVSLPQVKQSTSASNEMQKHSNAMTLPQNPKSLKMNPFLPLGHVSANDTERQLARIKVFKSNKHDDVEWTTEQTTKRQLLQWQLMKSVPSHLSTQKMLRFVFTRFIDFIQEAKKIKANKRGVYIALLSHPIFSSFQVFFPLILYLFLFSLFLVFIIPCQ